LACAPHLYASLGGIVLFRCCTAASSFAPSPPSPSPPSFPLPSPFPPPPPPLCTASTADEAAAQQRCHCHCRCHCHPSSRRDTAVPISRVAVTSPPRHTCLPRLRCPSLSFGDQPSRPLSSSPPSSFPPPPFPLLPPRSEVVHAHNLRNPKQLLDKTTRHVEIWKRKDEMPEDARHKVEDWMEMKEQGESLRIMWQKKEKTSIPINILAQPRLPGTQHKLLLTPSNLLAPQHPPLAALCMPYQRQRHKHKGDPFRQRNGRTRGGGGGRRRRCRERGGARTAVLRRGIEERQGKQVKQLAESPRDLLHFVGQLGVVGRDLAKHVGALALEGGGRERIAAAGELAAGPR